MQKIDDFIFKMFEMILASFKVEDKFEKTQFFQKTFLFAKLIIKVVLRVLFLTFKNADI